MKRLIRKISDAVRLPNYIDLQSAINAIKIGDQFFDEEKLLKDTGGSGACWGAIDDNATNIVEAYVYKTKNDDLKCAFVIAPINYNDNGSYSLSYDLQVTFRKLNNHSRTEAKKIATTSGIMLKNGEHLTFKNEFSSIEQAMDYVNSNSMLIANKM